MAYLALARKWRPRGFAEMVGQEHVVRALINALDREQLHHAYLFAGTRGVGKTTIARIFAKALNCEQGVSSTPCGECTSCREIDEGRFIDLIEVDAASNRKVEETRELLDNVQYSPARGRYKVYLIDEVHMLSKHSFNALLKTLEEPPPHVKFLLATTEPEKLPITVISRCLQFNLKRLPVALIEDRLQLISDEEKIEAEPGALRLLADAADGSMRDALSLMDQVIAFGDGQISEADTRSMLGTIPREQVLKLLVLLAEKNGPGLLEHIAGMDELAPVYSGVLDELLALLKTLALAQVVPEAAAGADGIDDLIERIAPEDVQLFYDIGVKGRASVVQLPDPRAAFEMLLVRMLVFSPAADVEPGNGQIRPPGDRSVENQTANDAQDENPAGKQAAELVANADPTISEVAGTEPGAAGWDELVGKIRVSGAARQLASNCELERLEEGAVWLRLAPGAVGMLTDQLKNRLRKGLSDFYGRDLKLHIEAGEIQSETLADRKSRESIEKQKAAEQSIASDPNIQAMQDAFGASVQDGSVQPLD
ncbi:MAG: DNA polymerase III subunit gamma/tau [Gammaproteobacteria bacterium]|nr:DNA polymerase III subunit gamma/tau [Gammaproteobacteria bacterium]